MPITAAQIQNDIVASFANVDPAGLVAGDIGLYWSIYADQAAIAPRLQELHTTRRCIDLLLRYYANQVDVAVGQDVDVKQSQISRQLADQRKTVDDEILRTLAQATMNRTPVVAAMTTTAPISPPVTVPVGAPDGNWPVYGGTIYQPIAWPRG